MSTEDVIELDGIVLEVLVWWMYRVRLQDMDLEITAYAAWKMKKHNIKIIPWDLVTVQLNSYEPTKWRIVFRKINKDI
jgi:translation initiation factor IF-1